MSSKYKVKATVEDAENCDIPIPSKYIGGGSPELINANAAHPATALTFPFFGGLHSGQWKQNKDGDLDWSYTAECIKRWSSDELLMQLYSHAFSIPARDYNPAAPFVYVHLANDHGREPDIIPLPHGYRLPLMFVGKYLWETILSSLSSAQESWDIEKSNLLHISWLCENTFARARVKITKGGMEKGWRCLIFDRFLARLYKHWIKNDSSSNADFLKVHGSKEYDRNVLRHDWKRWCLRGLHGVHITEAEVNSGITVDQYRKSLHRNRWTGIWMLDHKYPIFSAAEDRNPSKIGPKSDCRQVTEPRREISEVVTSVPSKRGAVTRGDENRPAKRVRLIVSGTNEKALGTPKPVSDIINFPNTSSYHASSPSTILFSVSRTERGPSEGQMNIDDADVGDSGNNNARDISPMSPLSITDSGGTAFSKPSSTWSVHSQEPIPLASWNSSGVSEKEEASSQRGSKSRTVENLLLSPKFSDGQRRTVAPILSSSASPLKPSKRGKYNRHPPKDEEVARRYMNEDLSHRVELTNDSRNQNPTDLPPAYTDQKDLDLLEERVKSVTGGKGRLFSTDTVGRIGNRMNYSMEAVISSQIPEGNSMTEFPLEIGGQSDVRPNDIAIKVGEVELGNSPGTTMVIGKTMGRSEVGVQVEIIGDLKDRKNKATQVELGMEDGYSTLHQIRQDNVIETQKMRSSLSALVDNLVSAKMQSLMQTMNTVKQPPLQEQAQSTSSRASADTNSMIKGLFDELTVLHKEAQSTERRVKGEIEAMRQLHSAEVDALRRRLSYLESHCATHKNRGRVYEIERDETLNRYDADESVSFAGHRCMVDKRSSYAPTNGCHANGFLNALVQSNGVEDSSLPIKTQRKQHIIASRAPVC